MNLSWNDCLLLTLILIPFILGVSQIVPVMGQILLEIQSQLHTMNFLMISTINYSSHLAECLVDSI